MSGIAQMSKISSIFWNCLNHCMFALLILWQFYDRIAILFFEFFILTNWSNHYGFYKNLQSINQVISQLSFGILSYLEPLVYWFWVYFDLLKLENNVFFNSPHFLTKFSIGACFWSLEAHISKTINAIDEGDLSRYIGGAWGRGLKQHS